MARRVDNEYNRSGNFPDIAIVFDRVFGIGVNDS